MSRELLKTLASSGIKFVRVLWCDNANIIRAKAIHSGMIENHLKSGVGISPAQQSIPAMYDAISPESGLIPVGEVRLIPDWDSISSIPYAPGHGRAMGDMYYHGSPWPLCPRTFLKRIIEEYRKEGIEIQASFENEFYLLKHDINGVSPSDNTVFASTYAMDMHNGVIGGITEALMAQGMQVAQYYPEAGPGQQEISIDHSSPLQAADNQIAFRETVHAVAGTHGLKASFLPKIFPDKAGSGCHLHISFSDGSKDIVADKDGSHGLSKISKGFIAGLLEHIQALMAITAPISNSYRRIKPHYWCGAFKCWGMDNREAAVRILTESHTGEPSHIEFKTLDATANPYLALGAILASGLDGIRRGLDPGEPLICDPGHLSADERAARGISALPENLGKTLEHLRKNTLLCGVLGKELMQAYLAVKTAEYEHMRDFTIADEVELLLERY